MRNRCGWAKNSLAYLEPVQIILNDLRQYWPLTLRQVYYQLVAALVIENADREYRKLSRMLTKARLDGLVEWDALEDRSRFTLQSAGYWNKSTFIESELSAFLSGYRRDLLQSQPIALEVWIEKDALSRVCHQVAFDYCVPVVVARGFSSVSYVHECRKRVEENAKAEKQTVILYFGDLDPSGWEMLPSMLETLQSEMNLGDLIQGKRCALTPEQVEQYGLPQSIDAMKDDDSRTPKFKAMLKNEGYPDTLAVELDALPPATLESLVRSSIEGNLDLSNFNQERQQQEAEMQTIASFREEVQQFVIENLE